ncbi:MAG: hypothetical protein JRN08_03565 [Nitrososphaerota archaeon]|nr:hypothetical protein [Nitrososphaerota archaeon]
MSRGFSIHESALVARGLGMTRSTDIVVGSVTAAVAANATVAMQFTGLLGAAVLAVLVFASVAVGAWGVSTDVYRRSSQTVSNLRSIGATKGAISAAMAVPLVLYGAAGSTVGAGVGAVIGLLLGGSPGVGLAVEVLAVVAASSAASASGVYYGVRGAWRS